MCDRVELRNCFLRKFERRSLEVLAKMFDRRCAENRFSTA